MGPVRPEVRAGDRLFRTHRPRDPAGAIRGPGARGGGRRRRGNGAGRGFPRRTRVRDATHHGHRNGRRSAADGFDGLVYSRNGFVPDSATPRLTAPSVIILLE